MKALIHARKARRTEEGFFHPVNGKKLNVSPDLDMDLFCLFAEDVDSGNELVCFTVDRTTMEQMEDNIHKALTMDPVRIRQRA